MIDYALAVVDFLTLVSLRTLRGGRMCQATHTNSRSPLETSAGLTGRVHSALNRIDRANGEMVEEKSAKPKNAVIVRISLSLYCSKQ